tara:strand:- start:131 stop:913 length:783 start_codon:yes stop_codon:yes gene_type:complete
MKKNLEIESLYNQSSILKYRIDTFKSKYFNKESILVYEENSFDIFLNKVFDLISILLQYIDKNLLKNKTIINFVKMIKNTIFKILDSFLKPYLSTQKDILKSKAIEKKLEDQRDIIENNIKENSELKREILKISTTLNKILDNSKKELLDVSSSDIGHNSNSRVDFYQEENLRLGSELVETKKKFDILKSEVEKYEMQRSNLISKINSVNDALKDTNVLTNVFQNDYKENKINILDHTKIVKNQTQNLNEQVKNIFSNSK